MLGADNAYLAETSLRSPHPPLTVPGHEITAVSTVDIYILDKFMTVAASYFGHHCD